MMPAISTLDWIPLWLLVAGTISLFLAGIELGFRFGAYRRRMPRAEDEAPSGAMVGATLGLLGFMLAFTFGMAASRFDKRKSLVLDEANAIGTAFLRAELLPAPLAVESRDLLRRYVETRVLGAEDPDEFVRIRSEDAARASIAESERLQGELWSRAAAAASGDPRAVFVGLYVESLNDLFDLHEVRMANVFYYRIPTIIWATLFALSIVAMLALGFHAGLTSLRRSFGSGLVTLAFGLVLSLIIDLDRGGEGFFQVNQQPLFDTMKSMGDAPR
jgi:hypothetical protein